jgi:uncharacterized membrane protein
MGAPQTRRLRPASIAIWLQKGWHDFIETPFISIAYAAVFCFFGAIVAIWLLAEDKGIFFFALAGGFMLVSPVLVTGYYRVSQMLREGKQPVFDDIVATFRNSPKGILFIGALVMLMFLIWMVDVMLVYSLIFGKETAALDELASQPGVQGNVAAFVVLASLMGSVLAFIVYTVTVFSIPDIFHRQSGFAAAILTSVKGVFQNLDVMLLWAAVLAVLTFGTLMVALPLIIVLFPVMGYASYAAYLDLVGELPAEA